MIQKRILFGVELVVFGETIEGLIQGIARI